MRLARIGVLCAFFSLCAPGLGSARRLVPTGFVGVDVQPAFIGSGSADVDRSMGRIAASGAETVRFDIRWAQVQPSAHGPYNFRRVDAFVRAALRHRLRIVAVVLEAPLWARLHPESQYSEPRNPRDFAHVLSALVRRYRPGGKLAIANHLQGGIRSWQVWNEPNGRFFWNDGAVNGSLVQAPLSHYATLLRLASRAIRSADRRASVMLAGLIPSYVDASGTVGSTDALRGLYRMGARRNFDVVAVHPYTEQVPNLLLILRQLRRAMDAAGDRRKPLAVTEMTWTSGRYHLRPGTSFGFDLTEAGQAAKVREAYEALAHAHAQLRLAHADWFAWTSPDTGDSYPFAYAGLLSYKSGLPPRAKPALAAYRSEARHLEGCRKTTYARCVR